MSLLAFVRKLYFQSLTDNYCRCGCLFEPHCLSAVVVSSSLLHVLYTGWTAVLILIVGESRWEQRGVWISWNESMDWIFRVL